MAELKIGENFLIQVNIRKAKKVYACTTWLNFPADAIEIIRQNGKPDVTKGDFLGDSAEILTDLSLNTANNIGTLLVGYSLKGNEPEKNGNGLMFSVRARALKGGDHQIVWSANSAIQDSKLVNQPSSFEDFLLKIEKDVSDVNIISITIESES